MENNDNYTIEQTENGHVIIFEKGCVIDYEYLWNQILVSTVLQNEHTEVVHGYDADSVKFNKKIKIEIKAIIRKPSNNG